MAGMPTVRYGLAAAVENGKLYAAGGYSSDVLNTVEVYDPSINAWNTAAPLLRDNIGWLLQRPMA